MMNGSAPVEKKTDDIDVSGPVLSRKAALWLGRRGLKGIGLDTISADPPDSQTFPVHKALPGNDVVIIKNLTNLEKPPGRRFIFSCLPPRFEKADGFPVRADAITGDPLK